MRSFTKRSNDTGCVFSFDCCDASGEIRFVAFDDICDKFIDIIEVGAILKISKGLIQEKNDKYNITCNDYEVVCDKRTDIIVERKESFPNFPLFYVFLVDLSTAFKIRNRSLVGKYFKTANLTKSRLLIRTFCNEFHRCRSNCSGS